MELHCLYDKLTTVPNLLLAVKKASKRKRYKANVSKFLYNLEKELFNIQKELKSKTYIPRPYRYFTLKDIKTRIISAADFRDRVVHHALLNIIEDIFEKDFISESYACRKDKGTHKAIKKAQKYVNKYQYFMKCDIAKYFDNIDHNILMEIVRTKIEDEDILWLCQVILNNASPTQTTLSGENKRAVGIPIGNLTSQFFANVYLDVLDHFITTHITGDMGGTAYIRYMDDFLMFSDNKDDLHIYLSQINKFLSQELKLKIKKHEITIAPVSEGLSFLGFRIYKNIIRVKNKNLQRTIKRFKTRLNEYQHSKIDLKSLENTIQSIIGHLKTGNTLQLRRKIFNDIIK